MSCGENYFSDDLSLSVVSIRYSGILTDLESEKDNEWNFGSVHPNV